MQGKRFTIGLFAGLLLGLVVVFSFSFASTSLNSFNSAVDLGTSRAAATTSTTTTGSVSSSTAGSSAIPTNSTSGSVYAVSTTSTSAQTTSSTPVPDLAFAAADAQVPSNRISSLSSIAAQPAVLGIVLLPIIFALVLGLLLKSASSERIEKD